MTARDGAARRGIVVDVGGGMCLRHGRPGSLEEILGSASDFSDTFLH